MSKLKYKRVLLKLSGESFSGEKDYGIDPKFIARITSEIVDIYSMGVELVIVIGGGNIFRGTTGEKNGLDRTLGDYMGMLATVMNSLALKDSFEKNNLPVRVMSALEMPEISELFIRDRAISQLKKGRIVISAAGTGNPYFSTDTAAALRALELQCELVMKATVVDGVFDKDPKMHQEVKKYSDLSHKQAIVDGLKVMDTTALSLCMDNQMPIVVFNILEHGNIKRIINGESVGTMIC